jgi:hypothetical protein
VLRDFRLDDQVAVRDLILQGHLEHWGSLDPALNRDLDDIQDSYGHGVTVVAVHGLHIGVHP